MAVSRSICRPLLGGFLADGLVVRFPVLELATMRWAVKESGSSLHSASLPVSVQQDSDIPGGFDPSIGLEMGNLSPSFPQDNARSSAVRRSGASFPLGVDASHPHQMLSLHQHLWLTPPPNYPIHPPCVLSAPPPKISPPVWSPSGLFHAF